MLVACSLLFFQVGLISAQWAASGTNHSPRGEKTVLNCFKEMDKINDIARLLLDISTPQKIDQFCRKMSELMQCIAENEHHLSTADNTNYLRRTRGVYQFFLNVCPPGTEITEKYKANAPCFKLMRNEILSCGAADLPLETSDGKKNDMSECCALKEYRDCMSDAAEKKCGPEASATLDKLLLRYYQVELSVCEKFSVRECHVAETTPYKKVTGYADDDERLEGKFNRFPDFRTTDSGYHHSKGYESWDKHKGKHSGGSGSAGAPGMVLLTALVVVFFGCLSY